MKTSESEERSLRDLLEKTQQENAELRARVEHLEQFEPAILLAHIARLERVIGELQGRLERADQVRLDWDERARGLQRELDIARDDQRRLRRVLEAERAVSSLALRAGK